MEMGIRNHIDGKGFWSERVEGDSIATISSGSLSFLSPMVSAGGIGSLVLTHNNVFSDSILMIDASAGSLVITLPKIINDGFRLTFKKIDQTGNTITVQGATSTELIDEELSKVISQPMSSMRLVTYNSKWWIF